MISEILSKNIPVMLFYKRTLATRCKNHGTTPDPTWEKLIGAIVASMGLWALPVRAQTDAQVAALVEAFRLAAPDTGTENDGLYSDWQIKPENIISWSRFLPTTDDTSRV